MKHFVFLLSFIFVFPAGYLKAEISDCKKPGMIIGLMKLAHIQPALIDDAFSELVLNRLLERIDPAALLFLEKEVSDLKNYKYRLDEEWEQNNCGFIDLLHTTYEKAVDRSSRITEKILNQKLDFSTKESFHYPAFEQLTYAADEVQLELRWKKFLKMEMLDLMFVPDPESGKIPEVADVIKKESAFRAKLLKKEKRRSARKQEYKGGIRNYILEIYLDVLAGTFDPHSTYFNSSENESFKAILSVSEMSFGIHWSENNEGLPEVSNLVPGAPAWNSGLIHKGDVLLKIKWEDGQSTISGDMEIHELIRKIEAPEVKSATFTLRKIDGQILDAQIVKEKIRSEENNINGYLISGKHKVGYIALPGFYTQWESRDPKGCSQDVAREIVKLKQENIEGLIIDLRYNGGGSMFEAMQLAGIFIDEGPLGISQYSGQKPFTFKDPNRGTVYDGPLLVLINRYSASASEVFAAAMQDYRRGLIAGTSSFGKASGQIILPLDTSLLNTGNENENTAEDFLKITTMKLYRINSGTHQQKGVVPDVHIPDISELTEGGEASYETSLKSDSTSKKAYYTKAREFPLAGIKNKSEIRMESDSVFIWLSKNKDRIIRYINDTEPVPLEAHLYKEQCIENNRLWDEFRTVMDLPVNDAEIDLHSYDKELISIDQFRKEIMENTIGDLKSDHQLHEAFLILNDLIEQP